MSMSCNQSRRPHNGIETAGNFNSDGIRPNLSSHHSHLRKAADDTRPFLHHFYTVWFPLSVHFPLGTAYPILTLTTTRPQNKTTERIPSCSRTATLPNNHHPADRNMPSLNTSKHEEAEDASWEATRGAVSGAVKWGLASALLGGLGYLTSPMYRGLTIQFKVYVCSPFSLCFPLLLMMGGWMDVSGLGFRGDV